MSTIPPGLGAREMRSRMEDKGAIDGPGGIYVGTGPGATTCLGLGEAGLPLVSNGNTLIYQALDTSAFEDKSITSNKIGAGGLVKLSSPSPSGVTVFDMAAVQGDLYIKIYGI